MAQDTDVARVAAALRAPAIRYRSFGNEPVRTPLPAPEADAYKLLSGMNNAAETPQSAALPPAEAWQPPPADSAPPTWPEPAPAAAWVAPPAPQWPAVQAPEWPPAPVAESPDSAPRPGAESAVQQAPSGTNPAPALPPLPPLPIEPAWSAPPAAPRAELPRLPPLQALPPLPEPAAPRPPPAPAAATGWIPAAPVLEPAPASAVPEAAPAPSQSPPTVLAQPAPAVAPRPGVEAMTLLRAADLMAPLPPPPQTSLATLAALAPAPAGGAAPGLPPRSLFPLIEALDLPGAMPPRRDIAATPSTFLALRPRPIAAADVDMPLPELLRLLTAGPNGAADAYTAMRRPPRADRPTT